MDEVARLPADDRRDLLVQTANLTGLDPRIIEKDFWVCWTLSRLYSIEGLPRLLFKGGTSLSKCFQLIERFSEDIDLGIEREDLGIGPGAAPSSDKGSKRLKRAREVLRDTARGFVEGSFLDMLRSDFSERLDAPHELRVVPKAGEPSIDFHYPRALAEATYGPSEYISSAVRLELGARSDHFPTTVAQVTPYAAERFPDMFDSPSCEVVAQAGVRTLLEKALILHTGNERVRFRARTSRHAYDLLMMWRAGTADGATRELFEQVAEHKKVFSDDRWAGQAPEHGIRLVPTGEVLAAMEADYRSMEQMFFSDPPKFEEVVEGLRRLEVSINSLD